jgi:hypothetical protein
MNLLHQNILSITYRICLNSVLVCYQLRILNNSKPCLVVIKVSKNFEIPNPDLCCMMTFIGDCNPVTGIAYRQMEIPCSKCYVYWKTTLKFVKHYQ